MRHKITALLAAAALAAIGSRADADLVTLGSAGNFAALAGSTVTNTGPSLVAGGDVGVAPGTAITGFGPGTLASPYTFHSDDAAAVRAQADLATAYGVASLLAPTLILTGQDLGGLTLTPGVYFFASTAQLTGTLTLDDLGDPNAQFVFRIGMTLTTAGDSSIVTINGGSDPGSSVFFQVGSSATLGTDTGFEGHILALTSITLDSGASILGGSALAINGAVTLDTNHIVNNASPSAVPEPASLVMAGTGGLMAVGLRLRRRRAEAGA